MVKINWNYLIGGIIVLVMIGTITISFQIDKDKTTIYRDGKVLAREKWIVSAERTYFNLDSWYDKNVKCPKVINLGGHKTATRCYYPNDYYEDLSRSLIRTKIKGENVGNQFITKKETPYYKYGTRGSYAGWVIESMYFSEDIYSKEEFPQKYLIN